MQDYEKWTEYLMLIHPIANGTIILSKQYLIPLENNNSNHFNQAVNVFVKVNIGIHNFHLHK